MGRRDHLEHKWKRRMIDSWQCINCGRWSDGVLCDLTGYKPITLWENRRCKTKTGRTKQKSKCQALRRRKVTRSKRKRKSRSSRSDQDWTPIHGDEISGHDAVWTSFIGSSGR